jgi:hypothetical protein
MFNLKDEIMKKGMMSALLLAVLLTGSCRREHTLVNAQALQEEALRLLTKKN